MLFGEKGIPGIPRLAGIDFDKADVKTALKQLNFSLGLVVEVKASPGPRLTRSCPLRNDHDATQLPLHLAVYPIFSIRGSFDRLDRQRLLVHQEVEAVKPMPRSLL